MDTFAPTYDEKVRPLMDKIDQIRSILPSNDLGITFPTVVVVGDQSSGKSTLLEALSLVELPKGTGIVTRCPLVLRLRNSIKRQVYHVHEGNKKVPLDETQINILKYIEEETKKLAGSHKNVVHDMIELLVEDPNVRDLTVVDLPGIARNPIADQPKDIHKQTTDLIRKFISPTGTVILCVFPANVDVATVESFTLAREVDPSNERTIGVITKSDLAPNQEVLIQQLLMEKSDVLQLTLGFVTVRNRSTDERMSLGEARRREKEFFRQHPALSSVGWHCLGIDALIGRLADLYSDRVKETFPKMRGEIQKKLRDVREQLSKFPPDLETPSARLAKYHELADFYVENILKVRFSTTSDGQHGSNINILHEKFRKAEKIIQQITGSMSLPNYRLKVRTAMEACYEEQLPNFLPHPVLKRLIGEKLDQLWQVIDVLINECFDSTIRLAVDKDTAACQGDILLNKLLPTFRNEAVSHLNEKNRKIHEQLQELIRLEKHDPYTMNPEYMRHVLRINEQLTQQKMSRSSSAVDSDDSSAIDPASLDDAVVQEMLFSIYYYWEILRKRLMDYTALSLRAGCDFDVCGGIREQLRLYPGKHGDSVDTFLAEDTHTRSKRKHLQQMNERLEQIDVILGGHGIMNDNNCFHPTTIASSNSSSLTLDALGKMFSLNSIDNTNASVQTKSIPSTRTITGKGVKKQ